jgi:hypothetical protein
LHPFSSNDYPVARRLGRACGETQYLISPQAAPPHPAQSSASPGENHEAHKEHEGRENLSRLPCSFGLVVVPGAGCRLGRGGAGRRPGYLPVLRQSVLRRFGGVVVCGGAASWGRRGFFKENEALIFDIY